MGDTKTSLTLSPKRLRLGIVFIALWWLPIWLLYPSLSKLLGFSVGSRGSTIVLIIILLVQTITGLIGVILLGKQMLVLLKQLPHRKVPGAMLHIVRTGRTEL